MKVLIIGAGLTGLSAAGSLKDKADIKIFEKEKVPGGLCRSENLGGFIFDYTGHFLHFKNKDIENEVKGKFNDAELREHKRSSYIFLKGVYVPYPFQSNIYHLPPELRKNCILDFINSRGRLSKPGNFYEWMIDQYGESIVRLFMEPYNTKMWTVDPRELTLDWMGRFVPAPDLEAILGGAISERNISSGYNACFYYPEKGIGDLVEKYTDKGIEIELGRNVDKVDLDNKLLVSSGKEYRYDFLINTSPLKDFVEDVLICDNDEMKEYASKLRSSSLLFFNIGWKGSQGKSVPEKTHWIYYPESKYCFYRVGFPSNVSKSLQPEGFSSCYVEISYPGGTLPGEKELNDVQIKVLDMLKDIDVIPDPANIVKIQTGLIENSYVIYDKDMDKARSYLLECLNKNSVFSGGRYGAWEYSSMEDAIVWGKKLASLCRL